MKSRNHLAISRIMALVGVFLATIQSHLSFFFFLAPIHLILGFSENAESLPSHIQNCHYSQRQRCKKWRCLLWFQTGLNWEKERKEGLCWGRSECKVWGERQVCCLLLHPSVLKVQVEPYSFRSACVCEEGGRKKGQWEKGSGEMEGQEWKRVGGWVGDSWWSLLKGIMGEERIAMAAM